ncbi:osmotically inducible lipoprotein OsmB [Constrictibacter sp. MBR-5]|jgi:hypothetical protein|uniref:hypothetical protein n=1 Tax=Constrictibacter sp. MBR-5 TaxID=3156467 RepID=UPI0033945D46
MPRLLKTSVLVSALALSLAACGNSSGERALSGAGLGAAGGALVGGLAGGSLVGGALIGGAAGAVAGAVTDKDDVNLGKPAWK